MGNNSSRGTDIRSRLLLKSKINKNLFNNMYNVDGDSLCDVEEKRAQQRGRE